MVKRLTKKDKRIFWIFAKEHTHDQLQYVSFTGQAGKGVVIEE